MHREPYGKYAQECQGVKVKESCFQEKLNLFTQSPFLELDFCRFLSPIFDSPETDFGGERRLIPE